MPFFLKEEPDRSVITAEGDVTVNEISDLKKLAEGCLSRRGLTVRLDHVESMDTSMMQLLVSARKQGDKLSREFKIEGLPGCGDGRPMFEGFDLSVLAIEGTDNATG
ncbi:MAG: STAS domain-containing protein [Nitrospirota bacterium]